jgi:hypothetical protein
MLLLLQSKTHNPVLVLLLLLLLILLHLSHMLLLLLLHLLLMLLVLLLPMPLLLLLHYNALLLVLQLLRMLLLLLLLPMPLLLLLHPYVLAFVLPVLLCPPSADMYCFPDEIWCKVQQYSSEDKAVQLPMQQLNSLNRSNTTAQGTRVQGLVNPPVAKTVYVQGYRDVEQSSRVQGCGLQDHTCHLKDGQKVVQI